MDRVCSSAPQLQGLIPYDPKYLPANAYLSANENPKDIDVELRNKIEKAIKKVPFNRYPDPLANKLREMIADANGLDKEWVLIGNGGDELLFDTALAWGGPGRVFLNFPPTFSVYSANAKLTNTDIVDIYRIAENDFSIDEEQVIDYLSNNHVDFTIITTPNNPTGKLVESSTISRILESTDALVVVDEAYFEFSRQTIRPLLEANKNLVILRTFSNAFSLAGVRIGYIFAHPEVIREYLKVRQPYSVDAVSQAIACVIFENRSQFEPGINSIIEERQRLFAELKKIPSIHPYPSDSNWILFRMDEAEEAWQYLYDKGILIRDFSQSLDIPETLRVTIGTREQNDKFLSTLRDFVMRKPS